MTFLDIPGYEGTYWVDSHGQVVTRRRKGCRGGIVTQHVSSNGYYSVDLHLNGERTTRTVHSLVAEAFMGPRVEGQVVRHLNGDAFDNNLENLAYGTSSENAFDAVRHGTHWQVVKTHCPQGHPYDAENTRVTPSRPTARYCRTCQRLTDATRVRAA